MSPHRINTCRGILTWATRAACIALLTFGTYLVLKRFTMAVVTRDIQSAFVVWEETGEGHSLYRGLAMLMVGGLLAGLSRAIPRWVFPAMPEGCPRCGYERVDQPRCPECGLGGFTSPPP
jgi:hypothetical protein